MKAITLLTVSVLLAITGTIIMHKSNKSEVYNVCQYARVHNTTMKDCHKLEDIYNSEYLCKDNTTSVNTYCWVEVK